MPKRAEGQKEVLIVEDDLATGTLLCEMLKFEGYGVKLSSSVPDALTQLKGSLPDLIFLDWVLPTLSGQDLLIAIDNDPLLQKIPIVVVTATLKPEQRVAELVKSHGLKIKVRKIIDKPFEYDDIADTARDILKPKNQQSS